MNTAGQLLAAQIDYIYFVYGLAFLLLAAVCATTNAARAPRLPWVWLACFSLVHGVHEWMELLAVALGDTPAFAAVRVGMLAVSFFCLVEFGRRAARPARGACVGCWVYLPLALAILACGGRHVASLNACIRYTLGLSGAAWAGYAMFRAAHATDEPGKTLTFGAIIMGCYAAAAGLVVPQAPFFPASRLNVDSFLAVTGLPIQPVRALLAILLSVTLWMHHQKRWRIPSESGENPGRYHGVPVVCALAVVLLAGWMATEWVGQHVIVVGTTHAAFVGPGNACLYRLAPIAVTLLTSVLLAGFFMGWQRLWETGQALKRSLAERTRLIGDLQSAAAEVKTLRGLIPICSNCKKIRDGEGAWHHLETYIQKRSEVRFTHGLCPECLKMLYPELHFPGDDSEKEKLLAGDRPMDAAPPPRDASGAKGDMV